MPRPERDPTGPWFLRRGAPGRPPGDSTGSGSRSTAETATNGELASDPDLVQALKQVLREDHPLPLLTLASTMLDLFDPRNDDPFGHDEQPRSDGAPREGFIASLEAVDVSTTTGLMTAIAELTDDTALRDRLQRRLEQRSHRLPHWLRRLSPLEVIGTWQVSDMFGDQVDIAIGVRTGSGAPITIMGLVDHNLGAIVTDVVAASEDPHDVLASIGDRPDHEDFRLERLDPAEARALLTDAIEAEARTWPKEATDTWPRARPLTEWILRALPEGGAGRVDGDFDPVEQDELVAAFLASPEAEAARLESSDDDVAEWLTWFRTGYGNTDPHRWSPPSVEIFLLDWVPRKIMTSVDELDRVPDVLRAHVRWGHRNAGIPARLTNQTLAVVDEFEEEYRELIRTPRHQGPMALLAAMGAIDDEPDPAMLEDGDVWKDWEEGDDWGDSEDWEEDASTARQAQLEDALDGVWRVRLAHSMLPRMAEEVGGAETLADLDTAPLADEPLQLDDVPDDVHDRVIRVAELVTEAATTLYEPEYAAAGRRLLGDVAAAEPAIFRRRSSDERLAAAVLWVVDRANSGWGTESGVAVAELGEWFGVTGSPASRARTLLAAIDREPADRDGSPLALGTTRYLTSTRREWLVEQRRLAALWPGD